MFTVEVANAPLVLSPFRKGHCPSLEPPVADWALSRPRPVAERWSWNQFESARYIQFRQLDAVLWQVLVLTYLYSPATWTYISTPILLFRPASLRLLLLSPDQSPVEEDAWTSVLISVDDVLLRYFP